MFAHTAPVFFNRGIASPATREISSLSMEPFVGGEAENPGDADAVHGPEGLLVGPGRYCSPRHRMPFNSTNEGSDYVG